jgi:hypothetical protein
MTPQPQPPDEVCPEAETLARDALTGYSTMVQRYTELYECSVQEALSKAQALQTAEAAEQVAQRPPREVSWFDFHTLSKHDPEQALHKWEQVKQAALDELQSGHRAGKVLETNDTDPWKRAQFAAMRNDLTQEWQPRSGIERQLIDTMALAQSIMLFWLEMLSWRAQIEAKSQQHDIREHGRWTSSRQSEAEAIEQAAGMVDRFNRIFLRTLRALGDLRRYSSAVSTQKPGTVNGDAQRVNGACAARMTFANQ